MIKLQALIKVCGIKKVSSDKVCMYKEMMMNDDNVESNLLTSSFIENT